MRIIYPLVLISAGATMAYASVEASRPGEGITRQSVTNNVNAVAPMAQGAGVMAGALLRSGAPVIAGAKDLLQQSGIGEMLTPPATVPTGGVPAPEDKPAPGTQP